MNLNSKKLELLIRLLFKKDNRKENYVFKQFNMLINRIKYSSNI